MAMSGISFRDFFAASAAGGSVTGCFGLSSMLKVYPTLEVKRGVIQRLPGRNAPGTSSRKLYWLGNRWILGLTWWLETRGLRLGGCKSDRTSLYGGRGYQVGCAGRTPYPYRQ